MAAEESSQWRRSGPLPPLPGGGGPSSGAGPRSSSFANASAPGAADTDRDWSAVRGSKFVPSAEASPRMGQAPLRSGGFVSENAAKAEAANEWRSSKPLATGPPPPSGGGSYRDVPPHQRGPPPPSGPADTEEQVRKRCLSRPHLIPSPDPSPLLLTYSLLSSVDPWSQVHPQRRPRGQPPLLLRWPGRRRLPARPARRACRRLALGLALQARGPSLPTGFLRRQVSRCARVAEPGFAKAADAPS